MRAAALIIVLLASGCDDEQAPEDVPFSAQPVTDRPPPPTFLPDDEPTASASAVVRAPPRPPQPVGGGIEGCCSALLSSASKARDAGKRSVYEQASRVCGRNAGRMAAGELTRAQALAQVRSSLLGEAPASCR